MLCGLMVLVVYLVQYGQITKNDRCLIKTIKTENITFEHYLVFM